MEILYDNYTEKIDMGIGTRVEIDFIDVLESNEGILVGDTAHGYVCVLAENRETDTYPPRPFRVNAGAIHQYIYIGDSKTKYLSELKAGDSVYVTDGTSNRQVTIGRIKIEKREFTRIVFHSGISATLQKADSIFLAGENEPVHFLDINDDSKIGVFPDQNIARHKGEIIEEDIIEK